MNLQEVMNERKFVVVGDTLNPEKYAYKIKHSMLDKGYTVYSAGKELSSINDVNDDIDIIDMCINPVKGLMLIKELKKSFKCIVLQPGSESPELIDYLESSNMPYIQGCLLLGLKLYKN